MTVTQLPLIQDNGHQVYLIDASPDQCIHSRYNTRKTRSAEQVTKLADRIARMGFEKTRAPWAVQVDGHYEIFAGGTRLEAAKNLTLETIPLMLHIGYTDEEISRKADEDNENDEYHAPVSIVEVWAEYARLRDKEGWTQEKIGQVKSTSQAMVSYRLALHQMPERIKEFINQGMLQEAHFIPILGLSIDLYFSSWLTTEDAQLELAEWAVGHTTRQVKEKVDGLKSMIAYASKTYQALPETTELYDLTGDAPQSYHYHPRREFVQELARTDARSTAKIKTAEHTIRQHIAQNLTNYQTWIEARSAEAARQTLRLEREQALFSKFHIGDFREQLTALPNDSVDLIFADPPYSEDHIADYGDLAQIAARILKPKGSLIVYAGHYALPRIFDLMCPHLVYWWQLIVKHAGGSARLPGKWVFVGYKPLLWFTKDGRRDDRYVSDLIQSREPDKALHPWQQDTAEACYCIQQLTDEGDLVIDPFCGSGTTVIAALSLNRTFWTCDIDAHAIEQAQVRALSWMEDNNGKYQ